MRSYDPARKRDDIVTGCYLGKVYLLSRGRNAFHGTWSSQYAGDDAFWPTLEGAQNRANEWRVQGSRFYIDELPVVIFSMQNYVLIVSEINTLTPLERYFGRKPASTSLADVAKFFAPPSENTIIRLLHFSRDIVVPILPYRSYTSKPQDAGMKLHWVPKPLQESRYETKYVEATVSGLRRWMKEIEESRKSDDDEA